MWILFMVLKSREAGKLVMQLIGDPEPIEHLLAGTEQVLSSLVGSWAFCLTMRASTLRTGEFSSPLKLVRYLVSAVDGNSIMLVICNKF